MNQLIRAAEDLIRSINNDMNLSGGLLSPETVRLSDELRVLIRQYNTRQ